MNITPRESAQKQVSYPNLPRAIYLEIAAHLEQIPGVSVRIVPENRSDFAYHHSQTKGIILESTGQFSQEQEQFIKSILGHYASIYGSYHLDRSLSQGSVK